MITYEKIVAILNDWRGCTVTTEVIESMSRFIMTEIPKTFVSQDSGLRDKLAMLYLKNITRLPRPSDPEVVFKTFMIELTKDAYSFADTFIKNIPNE